MAINKTTTLKTVNVYPASDPSAESTTIAGNPSIFVVETVTLDDSEDDQLPFSRIIERDIFRYVEDGGAATDITSEDALVQTIAGAIWS
jgi:hypothetical protein